MPSSFEKHQDLAIHVHRFEVEVSKFQGFVAGDRAVVGQQDRVGLVPQVRQDRLREVLAAGRVVHGDGRSADPYLHLRQHAHRRLDAGHREGRRVGRMGVDHRVDLGQLMEDLQVQQDLAGAGLVAADLLARVVHHRDVRGLQEPLEHPGRRTQVPALAQAETDVAVVGGREPVFVYPVPDVADLLLDFPFFGHCHVLIKTGLDAILNGLYPISGQSAIQRPPWNRRMLTFGTHWNLFGTNWNTFGSHWNLFGSHWNLFGSHWNLFFKPSKTISN